MTNDTLSQGELAESLARNPLSKSPANARDRRRCHGQAGSPTIIRAKARESHNLTRNDSAPGAYATVEPRATARDHRHDSRTHARDDHPSARHRACDDYHAHDHNPDLGPTGARHRTPDDSNSASSRDAGSVTSPLDNSDGVPSRDTNAVAPPHGDSAVAPPCNAGGVTSPPNSDSVPSRDTNAVLPSHSDSAVASSCDAAVSRPRAS